MGVNRKWLFDAEQQHFHMRALPRQLWTKSVWTEADAQTNLKPVKIKHNKSAYAAKRKKLMDEAERIIDSGLCAQGEIGQKRNMALHSVLMDAVDLSSRLLGCRPTPPLVPQYDVGVFVAEVTDMYRSRGFWWR